ncbi:class I SAM-dependent methyltransferase [Mesorhizobium sp. M3A.F.Ca.ET.174.01.1.1]|nr:class I SAM-dependent methyltransferase [Mesorhizobium sp. M3A.F.Ca.ET.080.04.2.1]PBB84720.1 methyltransferase type 11 [Mesorhizobium sp. WSM3876]RWB72323.1 MAG: class I SAM-dependent methyltransferase [Mesorhizobium sp.]TGS61799.1 class I SAM-dependent methyltransferase [Mesorhizobium sp. M3A.F.Ca.ET.201.01.1.1]TGS89682.1 class I SAM-dependent methyltransferase [Mesorhizobium sp. M3A.F.Ca.ET.175.01.1.1]TGT31455.1 class I SAM-dependent methyltransferase [Mesorhizobium sp. M3A.F.Ca.ET.174.01
MSDGVCAEVALARLAACVEPEIGAAELAKIAMELRSSQFGWRNWLEDIAALLATKPDVFDQLRATAASVCHERPDGETAAMTIERLASGFDRAAAISAPASVQLSSLGDEEKLCAATAEICSWLEQQGFGGTGKAILDIGCGIGRFEAALHAKVGHIVGTDISSNMIAIARQRCAGLATVELRRASGFGLDDFADESFDGVLAVDSFPYLVLAGVAERHFGEIARVLRRGGMAAILNYSYREAGARDRCDVRSLADAHRLDVLIAGEKPFSLWDGAAFLVRRGCGT